MFYRRTSDMATLHDLISDFDFCLRCDYDGFTWPQEVEDFVTGCRRTLGACHCLDPEELRRRAEVRQLTVNFGRFVYGRGDIDWPVDIRSFLYALAQLLSIYPGEFGGDAVGEHFLRINSRVHKLEEMADRQVTVLVGEVDALKATVAELTADVAALKAAAAGSPTG